MPAPGSRCAISAGWTATEQTSERRNGSWLCQNAAASAGEGMSHIQALEEPPYSFSLLLLVFA
jgi:hypothetical protein